MRELPPFLLFDLDDTLVRFSSGPGDLWDELSAPFAPRLGVDAALLLATLRRVASAFWSDPVTKDAGRLELVTSRRTIVSRALEELGCTREEVGRELADAFTWTREERVAPLPGALDTLDRLRALGHRLGLVTNGSGEFQRRKLARYDLEPYFEDIRIEGEQGIGKPHAPVFERALEALGARPEQAWMIGDNLSADIAGAQALGIRGVWVDIRHTGLPDSPPAMPDAIVRSVSELLASGG